MKDFPGEESSYYCQGGSSAEVYSYTQSKEKGSAGGYPGQLLCLTYCEEVVSDLSRMPRLHKTSPIICSKLKGIYDNCSNLAGNMQLRYVEEQQSSQQ